MCRRGAGRGPQLVPIFGQFDHRLHIIFGTGHGGWDGVRCHIRGNGSRSWGGRGRQRAHNESDVTRYCHTPTSGMLACYVWLSWHVFHFLFSFFFLLFFACGVFFLHLYIFFYRALVCARLCVSPCVSPCVCLRLLAYFSSLCRLRVCCVLFHRNEIATTTVVPVCASVSMYIYLFIF